LRWVADAGLGDPFEFVANPNDRVPMTAVRYWEDTLATEADVINGRARVSVEGALGLVMTITPTEGGNLRLRVNGAPMVASGFPPETSPRPRAPEPATAKANLQAALGVMGVPAAATLGLLGPVDPKSDASMAQFVNTADPGILGQLRAGVAPAPAAMAVFDAAASWQLRHVPLPGGQRVLTGDEANTAQLDPASAAHWVIAGVGGTGISAAEIILDKNRDARVTMYGGTATAGLFDNVQARRVMRLYGPMGDRRFQVITSQDVGALTTNDGGATYDVGAVTGDRHLTAVPGDLGPWQAARRILAATDPLLLPTIRTLLQADRAAEQHHITTRQPGAYARMLITFVGDNLPQPLRDAPDFALLLDEFGPVCGTIRLQVATGFGAVGAAGVGVSTGRLSVDGYIAAIGRRGQSSPAIQSLLADAIRDGHAIAPSLLWDDDGRYIGYRITITAGANPPQHVDCVGAASRFLPIPPFRAGEQELVTRAGVADAPPESGNFDGGFAASAIQAQAYARHRRDEPSRRITTLQLTGVAAPLVLAIGAPAATWEAAVQQFLVAELRVPADTVTVTTLAGGASGDAVFRVRVGRHERIFKVFANNQAPNELAQLQYVAGLHLEEFHAVQGHVGTQAAVGANRAGVLMESAVGTSIEEMIAHLPPAGTLRDAHVDRIMRSSRRVADGLAELHAATENGFQSRAQKDGPGSSAHAILNVKLPAIQAHLAPHYATIVGQFTQAVQQYVAANVPAVAYHGDANAGNFIL
ncbi:MAG TPA: phosphotransferase, partial [Kofleriaceae bacterium]